MPTATFLKGGKMASDKKPRQLSDNFMFPKLFQAFRMAVQPGKLIVALLGLMVICLAGYLMDFSGTVVVNSAGREAGSELDVYMAGQDVQAFQEKHRTKGSRTGVFSTLWDFGSKKFHAALRNLFEINFASMADNIGDYFKAVAWAMRFHYAYCLVFVVIKLAVLSVIGGAVCRMAALQFARGERTGIIEALRFGVKRFTSFFFAPLLPIIGIGFVAGIIFVLGLGAKIPYVGGLIMALLMVLVLFLGTLIAITLIGTAAGFNLMFPAVAYDGADAFDSVSRSFSYVFSRPWRMGFYTLTATIHGAICYVFVRLFAFLLLSATHLLLASAVGLGGNGGNIDAFWGKPEFMNLIGSSSAAPTGVIENVAAVIIYLALWVVAGLVVAVVINYYYSANTIIYALMRNKVDNAEIDEIHQDAEEPGIDSIATLARL
jgi:hypothetical protein